MMLQRNFVPAGETKGPGGVYLVDMFREGALPVNKNQQKIELSINTINIKTDQIQD
jgi:hypothetical protein